MATNAQERAEEIIAELVTAHKLRDEGEEKKVKPSSPKKTTTISAKPDDKEG